jgi:hypothetical protein
MKPDPASLDALHDIVLPAAVSWWPLAPGWYVALSFVLVLVLVLLRRAWKHWQANAYRRAALRALATVEDAPAIAEILRRTALAVAPRPVVAGKTGAAWTDWLAAQCPEAIPDAVRAQLTTGVYGRPPAPHDIGALRAYAARWIKRHRIAERGRSAPSSSSSSSSTA